MTFGLRQYIARYTGANLWCITCRITFASALEGVL